MAPSVTSPFNLDDCEVTCYFNKVDQYSIGSGVSDNYDLRFRFGYVYGYQVYKPGYTAEEYKNTLIALHDHLPSSYITYYEPMPGYSSPIVFSSGTSWPSPHSYAPIPLVWVYNPLTNQSVAEHYYGVGWAKKRRRPNHTWIRQGCCNYSNQTYESMTLLAGYDLGFIEEEDDPPAERYLEFYPETPGGLYIHASVEGRLTDVYDRLMRLEVNVTPLPRSDTGRWGQTTYDIPCSLTIDYTVSEVKFELFSGISDQHQYHWMAFYSDFQAYTYSVSGYEPLTGEWACAKNMDFFDPENNVYMPHEENSIGGYTLTFERMPDE